MSTAPPYFTPFSPRCLMAAKVACAGDAAPMISGIAVASGTFAALGEPVTNNQDELAFIGSLAAGGVVNKTNSQGIWLWTGSTGTLSQVTRAQELAADCAGAKFASFPRSRCQGRSGLQGHLHRLYEVPAL